MTPNRPDEFGVDECIESLIDAKTLTEKFSARNQLDLAIKRKIDASTAAPSPAHLDDWWVDLFAKEMKEKLAKAREKGRGGWQDCAPEALSKMLLEHVEKGDPRDVANFCMFLWAIRSPISATPQPAADAPGIMADPVEQFLSEIREELLRARSKFPGNRIMTIALAEEFGELCKAILDESAASVRKEAIQTAVMCARVVLDGDGSVISWRSERGLDALVTVVSPASGDSNAKD
jgi:hypothetical protein